MAKSGRHDHAMINTFVDELEAHADGGSSDRIVALVGAAGLEYILAGVIRGRLHVHVRAEEIRALAGSFSSAITLAFAAGAISKDERRELDLIRRIRNQFAHDLGARTFDHSGVAHRCRELVMCDRMFIPTRKHRDAEEDGAGSHATGEPVAVTRMSDPQDMRERFRASVMSMTNILCTRGLLTVTRRLGSPPEFASPVDLINQQVDGLESGGDAQATLRRRLLGHLDRARETLDDLSPEVRSLVEARFLNAIDDAGQWSDSVEHGEDDLRQIAQYLRHVGDDIAESGA